MRPFGPAMLAAASLAALAACSDPKSPPAAPKAEAPPSPAAAPPAPLDVATGPPLAVPPVTGEAADSPLADAINQAELPGAGASRDAKRNALVRAEVLLARARFSPGVIDGQDGGNLKAAVAAFEQARGLPVDGKLTRPVWDALVQADSAPAVVAYTIAPQDVAGPFVPVIPTEYDQMAKLDRLAFTSPLEALAEKFHMDEALLAALNPGVDVSSPGGRILVVAPGPERLDRPVASLEVDKAQRQVRAYGADGTLLAAYPATVGSTERPAPTGRFKVTGAAPDPTYTYDPKRLTFGDKSLGKLTIRPGPNNPVGVEWISISVPTYGIHGAPDPRLVGKVASHGCVRLTNWDVRQLASGVKPGVPVTFIGQERPAHPAGKVSSASAG